jgi:LPS O-antigen subunit length determinant protein (WzzB/FepE family)
MDNNQINQQPQQQAYANHADDEIDLRELFGILWAEKKLIIGVTAFFAVASVIYALMLTNIYRAESVLAPADTEQSAGGLAAQFGGAAALLGVNVGSNGGDAISTALATLRSRQFLGRFIEENGLLVPLFASNWDSSTQQSVIDEDVYNPVTGEWLLETGPPTSHDSFRVLSNILVISEPDRDTGIVTVAIDWPNPIEAASWVNMLVSALNQDVKARDVQEATNAITYLQEQLVSTQLVDMQRVFYQLIESQTRITMLADVRDEYVFRVIDPAVVPDQRISPRRAFICILGSMIGGMFALLVVFLRRFLRY